MAALPKNQNIKIFSYNICWETTKPYGTGDQSPIANTDIVRQCQQNVQQCRNNVAKVIRSKLPLDFIALQEIPFTVPKVPTGMNFGVSTSPCGVVKQPTRARVLGQ